MSFPHESVMKTLIAALVFLTATIAAVQAPSDSLGHERWEYLLEESGDILQIAIPLSAGIITLLKRDFEGTKQLALSYGTTLAITYAIKYASRVKRPEGRDRYDSFPSGHTSSAFSGASFL